MAAISLVFFSAMQTNSLPTLFKQIRIIFAPFFVGALIGVLMGGASVLLLKILPSNYTQKQKELAFILFTLFGAFMGLVDTVRRYLAWLQFRKSQQSQGKGIGSD